MHTRRILFGAAAALALTIGAASAQPAGIMMKDGLMVDAKGMTLYTFDKDEPGKSNCYDQCAVNWPPLIAEAGAAAEGDFSLVERTDGSMQWAYDGMPLYLFIKDKAPGDATGDGVGDVWHVIAE